MGQVLDSLGIAHEVEVALSMVRRGRVQVEFGRGEPEDAARRGEVVEHGADRRLASLRVAGDVDPIKKQ